MFGIIIWRIWRLRKRMLNILSIWELRIWHPIVVKIRIILIGISHLCIQTRVKSKQNKTEKTRCHWRIIVWQYYQNVTIYTKQFYCLLKKKVNFLKNNLSNLFAGKLSNFNHRTVNMQRNSFLFKIYNKTNITILLLYREHHKNWRATSALRNNPNQDVGLT